MYVVYICTYLRYVPLHTYVCTYIYMYTFSRLQNCHLFLTDNLEKVWKDFVAEEKAIQTSDTTQRDMGSALSSSASSAAASTLKKGTGLVAAMASRVRKRKGATINKEELVHVS